MGFRGIWRSYSFANDRPWLEGVIRSEGLAPLSFWKHRETRHLAAEAPASLPLSHCRRHRRMHGRRAAHAETRSAPMMICHAETNFAKLNYSTIPIRRRFGTAAPWPFPNQLASAEGTPIMNTPIIGLIAFAAILAGAFAGVEVRERLPDRRDKKP